MTTPNPFPSFKPTEGESEPEITPYMPHLKRKLSTIDETPLNQVMALTKELKLTKQRLKTTENKNTQLLSQVFNLRRLMKRIAYEEDLNMIRLEQKLSKKNLKIQNLEQNIRFLEQNSKWLDDIAGFWSEVVDRDMEVDSDDELKQYLQDKYGKGVEDQEEDVEGEEEVDLEDQGIQGEQEGE